MKYAAIPLAFVLGIALACGVQSGKATDGQKLPPVVIEMYDAAAPGGAIEIEAERDGTVIEIEVGIDLKDAPKNLVEAANKALPGGEVTGAEYEWVGGKKAWEIKKVVEGLAYELVFDAAGNLLEKEAEVRREDAPKAVIDAAMGVVEGSSFKSVELITKGEKKAWHVKTVKDGASYKIVLSDDGTIQRKVREAPAEIEIPMK